MFNFCHPIPRLSPAEQTTKQLTQKVPIPRKRNSPWINPPTRRTLLLIIRKRSSMSRWEVAHHRKVPTLRSYLKSARIERVFLVGRKSKVIVVRCHISVVTIIRVERGKSALWLLTSRHLEKSVSWLIQRLRFLSRLVL
jgi:hypothetical protein